MISRWSIRSKKGAEAGGRTLCLDLDQAEEGQAVLLDRKLSTGRVGQTLGAVSRSGGRRETEIHTNITHRIDAELYAATG